ncbi:MAG: biotin/lipoyl-containing protein [Terracidiphilus sp.]
MKLQISIDGKTYEAEVEILEDDAMPRQTIHEPGPALPAAVQSTPVAGTQSQASAAKENADDSKLCRSPVTGVVIKVNVGPGQPIQANDLIMVLEAMKMETNITAPRAGIVRNVRVAQGDSVKVGEVVVEFE